MKKAKVPLQPRYSGQYGRKFWERVNSLTDNDHTAAYKMGCMLRDLEDRVLEFINETLLEAKK